VLYSPGLGTSRTFGSQQVEDLVSHGYVVVTVDHTGEAPAEFPGGRITTSTMPSADDTEVYRTAIRTRTEDLGFVLDQLERLPVGFLDLKHVGVLGFSAGGFAGAQLMLTDRRVDAGVNLDGRWSTTWTGRCWAKLR
jgi:predicted dienelactone hydrolase